MKKITMWLLSLVVAVAGLCAFVACGNKDITGTYKFQSLKMTEGGMTIELKVGEKFMGLVELTEDYAVFEIKEDGTFSVSVMEQASTSGTWEEKDGGYVFTSNGDPISAKLDGSTLIFSEGGVEFTLKKA